MLVHLGDRILYSHKRNQLELYMLTRKTCHNIFLRVKSKTGGSVYRPFACVLTILIKNPKIYMCIETYPCVNTICAEPMSPNKYKCEHAPTSGEGSMYCVKTALFDCSHATTVCVVRSFNEGPLDWGGPKALVADLSRPEPKPGSLCVNLGKGNFGRNNPSQPGFPKYGHSLSCCQSNNFLGLLPSLLVKFSLLFPIKGAS